VSQSWEEDRPLPPLQFLSHLRDHHRKVTFFPGLAPKGRLYHLPDAKNAASEQCAARDRVHCAGVHLALVKAMSVMPFLQIRSFGICGWALEKPTDKTAFAHSGAGFARKRLPEKYKGIACAI
jgi:hypothetical protein